MGNLRKTVLVGALSAAFVVGAAPSALAHGNEHDVHRVAAGAAGGFDVSVWTADAPAENGELPFTVSVASKTVGEGPDQVRVTATTADGVVTSFDAESVDGTDQWLATIPTSGSQPTSVVLTVVDGGAESELGFVYTAPGSTWWMKLIIVAALAHGAVCATWLYGRRHRALRRPGAALAATATV